MTNVAPSSALSAVVLLLFLTLGFIKDESKALYEWPHRFLIRLLLLIGRIKSVFEVAMRKRSVQSDRRIAA